MAKIKELEINDFLKKMASESPTPGGGAVAALAGAMAASLVEMVSNITIGKKGYEKVAKELKKLRNEVRKSKLHLLRLADEDVKAFAKVMTAYKSKDKRKIKKALLWATAVPSQTAKLARQVERLGLTVAKIGNKNAVSDAKTAVYLARAARLSALENVKINKRALAKRQ